MSEKLSPERAVRLLLRVRPYIAWGRRQFRLGWRVIRPDRWSDEYHFVGIEWHV